MGFLDKVKDAAKSAKDELDKSGIVDKARDKAREQFGSGDENTNPVAPPTDRNQFMIDAIRRGAVDPATLISVHQMASVAAAEVQSARAGYDDTFVSAIFETESGRGSQRLTLSVCHNVDDDGPWDADEYWAYLLETYGDEAVHIGGLGDDAFRQGTYVWAKAVGRIVFADVAGNDVDDATATRRAEAMVRLAVPRLPPLDP